MGHIRLGALPRTRDWDDVVELVTGGADAASVAALSCKAANAFFELATVDPGFLEAAWLLVQLPQAARAPGDDYLVALRELGLDIEGACLL